MSTILGITDLEILIEDVSQKIRERLIEANREGNLDNLLKKYEFSNDETKKWDYYEYDPKIIVIGSINTKKKGLI